MGSLIGISTARMISLSEAWLDPARDRPIFEALNSGKPLLDMIQAAHDGLAATQRQDDPVSREIAGISDRQARIDKRHDRKIRAIYYLLNGLAEASDDPNEIADLLGARDELLPNGLSTTKESYSDEAEHVEIAAKRVSAASKGLLKKLVLPRGVNLWLLVEQWFAAGRELGILEQQKIRLGVPPGQSSAETLQARNAWLRVVRHVESTLSLEGASTEVTNAILGPVLRARMEEEKRIPEDSMEMRAPDLRLL